MEVFTDNSLAACWFLEYLEWAKHSEDGYTVIGLTISSSQQPYIQDCNSGHEA
jgi:hypothetical protein